MKISFENPILALARQCAQLTELGLSGPPPVSGEPCAAPPKRPKKLARMHNTPLYFRSIDSAIITGRDNFGGDIKMSARW